MSVFSRCIRRANARKVTEVRSRVGRKRRRVEDYETVKDTRDRAGPLEGEEAAIVTVTMEGLAGPPQWVVGFRLPVMGEEARA